MSMMSSLYSTITNVYNSDGVGELRVLLMIPTTYGVTPMEIWRGVVNQEGLSPEDQDYADKIKAILDEVEAEGEVYEAKEA